MPFWNRPRITPDVIAVPQEPSAAERAAVYTACDVVVHIDAILDAQQAHWPEDRNVELIDVLLDLRNLLTVPAVPGRSS